MELLAYLVVTLAALAGAYVFLQRVWFYRDPPRRAPDRPDTVVSPADGIVLYVRPFAGGEVVAEKQGTRIQVEEILRLDLPQKEGWLVGIYMSPLDVHFNYAPMAGEVTRVVYTPTGINLSMVGLLSFFRLTFLRRPADLLTARYRLVNERNTIVFQAGERMVAAVEICDRVVNRITCFVREGDRVAAGQKISFIDRGSQVDLVIFDPAVTVHCRVGDRVRGAETVLATFAARP
ncbi:MAG: phosphatidylserine decarboxylase [bacterium]|nr:phosphatidylserine decarboxylase [bacterium]